MLGSESEAHHSALFAQLVMQQANMALMLLGKMPHPETGKTVTDLQAAGFFIDILDMLDAKTKGNLSKDESDMLKSSLMSLRMAFVEATNDQNAAPPSDPAPRPNPSAPEASTPLSEPPTGAPADEESRKKFTKKY